jgi:hypothetical protein
MSDDPEFEEIGHGPDRPVGGFRLSWLLITLVLVGAGVVAFIQHRSTVAAHPASTASTGPARPALVQQPAAPFVAVGDICPVVTDHRHVLTVSFTLVGLTPELVRVTGVEPVLPLGGLRPLATTVEGGTCVRPHSVVNRVVLPSEGLLVTMRLALPKGCPQAFPVMANIHELVDGRPVIDGVPVLSDLGNVTFVTCEPTGTAGSVAS